MKIVSPFLKKVVYPSVARSGMLTRAGGMAVVTYHGVLPEGYESMDAALDGNLVTAKVLDQHLSWLKNRYSVIAPENVLAWQRGHGKLPERAVLITCDDGLVNCLTDMLPVLQHHGVRCLFFVTGMSAGDVPDMLWYEELLLHLLRSRGARFDVECGAVTIRAELKAREQRLKVWWEVVGRLSQLPLEERSAFLEAARQHLREQGPREFEKSEALRRRFALVTAGEVRELLAAGMTVGAHTMSHPLLAQASPEAARWEMAESRARLQSALQQEIWALAYPFGDPSSVTPQVVAIAQQEGFEAAFLNYGGGLGAELAAHELPRVHVTAGMTVSELDAHVSGLHAGLQKLASRMMEVS